MVLLLKFWKPLTAVLVVLVVTVAIYGKGVSDAKTRTELAAVQAELVETQRLRAIERAAYDRDATAAREAQNRLSGLTDQIDELSEYVSTLEDASRECLAPADTDRLRNLWK